MTNKALQKEQHLVSSTEQQPLTATDGEGLADGEGNAAAVLEEHEPLKNEGGDGRMDADLVTDATLQKEQDLPSTNTVVKEWETDSEQEVIQARRSPIFTLGELFSSNQEVSQ